MTKLSDDARRYLEQAKENFESIGHTASAVANRDAEKISESAHQAFLLGQIDIKARKAVQEIKTLLKAENI